MTVLTFKTSMQDYADNDRPLRKDPQVHGLYDKAYARAYARGTRSMLDGQGR